MAEDHASTTGEQGAGSDEGQKQENKPEAKDDIEQIAAQAEKPDAVRNAIQAEREKAEQASKEVKKLAAELKKYQDRDKSEQEKLVEAKEQAEKDAAEARGELLRLKVAAKKGLDPEVAEYLRGSTEKELEDSADRLLDKFKPSTNGDPDAGKGETTGGGTMNDLLRGGRAA